MTRSRQFITSLGLAALAAFWVSGCKSSSSTEETQPATANIQVSAVHAQPFEDPLVLPGRVEADPDHVVHIYAPLSGRLLNMTAVPGQELRKGQTVGELQSGDVAQARSDFEKARIEALRADRALTRGKLLAAHEVMSQADLQELQATDDAAHSEQERARQRIHELGFSENGTSDIVAVTSPISGTVLDIGTASGELQRSLETTTGIATVANLDTIWVTGDLYEQDLGSVHLHDPVTITFPAYPGQNFRGTVANIGDSLDPQTHAVKVRVVLANPDHKLKPAMFATLQIARPTVARIMVPQAAVLHDGNATEVYVPDGQGKYAPRKVTTGATHGDQVEIVSGLRDGEQVVTEGAAFLREPAGD
ncbi:MAG TPA: efflux RND transporter periplasmic adaptor subunit [Acidobacteriaceae bacterium]|nr:efflux RND transporter periplasmic adaptor subunit [Acidobacteriaceae bacterium]